MRRLLYVTTLSILVVALAASVAMAQEQPVEGTEPNPEAFPCDEILTTFQGVPNFPTLNAVQRFGSERVEECVEEVGGPPPTAEQPEPVPEQPTGGIQPPVTPEQQFSPQTMPEQEMPTTGLPETGGPAVLLPVAGLLFAAGLGLAFIRRR